MASGVAAVAELRCSDQALVLPLPFWIGFAATVLPLLAGTFVAFDFVTTTCFFAMFFVAVFVAVDFFAAVLATIFFTELFVAVFFVAVFFVAGFAAALFF